MYIKLQRGLCEMKIDLSMVDIFEDSELELDKKITFIFGKNGTGKSTFTEEIKKMTSDYDVSIFQGFNNIIDENHQLNAVVLGEENIAINAKIEEKKKAIELKEKEIARINKNLSEPEIQTSGLEDVKHKKNIMQQRKNLLIFIRNLRQLSKTRKTRKLRKHHIIKEIFKMIYRRRYYYRMKKRKN